MDANFDWKTYVNNYEDLQKAGINTAEKAWMHWIMYGKYEDRTFENIDNLITEDFDWKKYIEDYDDLKKAGINTKVNAWKHWAAYGIREGRIAKKIIKNNCNKDFIYHNDIIIYCCNVNTLAHIYNLSYFNDKFKQIYLICEEEIYTKYNNVKIIKTDKTINYFYKYFIGIKEIMNENITFNKIWFINDNIIIKDFSIFQNENIFIKIKSSNISIINYLKLQNFACNFIILNNKYAYEICKELIKFDLYNDELDNVKYIEKCIVEVMLKTDHNILLTDDEIFSYIYIVNNYHNITNKLVTYINYYENIFNFVLTSLKFKKIYDYFYNYKNFLKVNDNIKNIKNELKIYEDISIFKKIDIFCTSIIRNNGLFEKLCELFNCDFNFLLNTIKMIKFIRCYEGNEDCLLFLRYSLFKIIKQKTTFDDLKTSIYNIHANTGNKKLVYTHNINYYDLFWDIETEYLEKDTDYIYISNVDDEYSCKNFNYVYCNIDNDDNFYVNRKIKFDKTLYDCYEYVLYIDSNIRINSKLEKLFSKIKFEELVLFSHPQRTNVLEEINTLINTNSQHNKWCLDKQKIDELINNFNVNNKLYWLSVQLSNTKINIFDKFYNLYNYYKLKRDQIYLSLVQQNYKITCVEIKTIFDYQGNYFDADFGFINNWSCYFNRPFGGNHI